MPRRNRSRKRSTSKTPAMKSRKSSEFKNCRNDDVSTSNILFIACLGLEIAFGVARTFLVNAWQQYQNKEHLYVLIPIAVVGMGYKLTKSAEDAAYFRGREGKQASTHFLRITKVGWCFGILGVPAYFSDQYLFGIFPGIFCVLLTYYASYYFSTTEEQTGGVSDDRIYTRHWRVWMYFASRFQLKIEKTVSLNQKKQYIFGNHPHAILPFGSMVALNAATPENSDSFRGFDKIFPGLSFRTLAATFCFYVPGYRELCLYAGVVDAARYSARRVLSSGKSLMLIPGGATEALYCKPNEDVVYLKKRFGFVKLALESGCDLVPVFSFNECNCWKIIDLDESNGNSVKRFFASLIRVAKHRFQRITGLSLPLVINVMPLKSKITVVVGKPIPVKKVEKPTNEQVKSLLDTYIDALKKLHEKHRHRLSPGKPSLKVI